MTTTPNADDGAERVHTGQLREAPSMNPSGSGVELLGCPFCGPGNSIPGVWFDDTTNAHRVNCGACGSGTGFKPGWTEAEAIAAWNRRAPQPSPKGGEAVAWQTRCENVETVLARLSSAAWRVIQAHEAWRSPDRDSHPNLVLEEAEAWVGLRACFNNIGDVSAASPSLDGEVRSRLITLIASFPAHERDLGPENTVFADHIPMDGATLGECPKPIERLADAILSLLGRGGK